MALNPWQQNYLASVAPLNGLSQQDTAALVARYAFNHHDEDEFDALWARFVASDASEGPRLLRLGLAVGYAQGAQDAATNRDESPGGPEDSVVQHPDLADLADALADAVRLPDILRMHAYAQGAMLDAVRRLADAATTVGDIDALASAYLTLPGPREDFGHAND